MEVSVIDSNGNFNRIPLEQVDFHNIRIVTMLEPDENSLIFLKQVGLDVHEIDFNGSSCYVVIDGNLRFYESPRKSLSKGSQAVYLVEGDDILLQYLAPCSETSRHYHERRTEIYHSVEGRAVIDTGVENEVAKGSSFIVRPKTVHQVKTNEEASLMVIILQGESKGLTLEDHFYVE